MLYRHLPARRRRAARCPRPNTPPNVFLDATAKNGSHSVIIQWAPCINIASMKSAFWAVSLDPAAFELWKYQLALKETLKILSQVVSIANYFLCDYISFLVKISSRAARDGGFIDLTVYTQKSRLILWIRFIVLLFQN